MAAHKQLMLLGLLQRGPMHGYELHRIVHTHGELYTDLKKANVYYLLDRLAKAGCVEVKAEAGVRGARGERLVYALTDSGRARFAELLRDVLRDFEPAHTGLDVAVVFLNQLPLAEAIALLEGRRATVAARREGAAAELGDVAARGLPGALAADHLLSLMHRLESLRSLLSAHTVRRALRRRAGRLDWPVLAGANVVGDPAEAVAVCTLTNNDLMRSVAALPGVAIAGRVYTANLGLEKIVLNITANPRIRFLLLCGRDSPLFHPGQTLRALCTHGVTPDGHVVGADGYLPVLGNVPLARIEQFRRQVELVDCTGETDLPVLAAHARDLAARSPGPFRESVTASTGRGAVSTPTERFSRIQPGGKREPLAYDPKGYFVITLDRSAGEIVLRQYLLDNSQAHEMRGRSGGSMLLGLVREKLVSQLSHAGYIGAELARAEAALRLQLRYEQDQPLRAGPA